MNNIKYTVEELSKKHKTNDPYKIAEQYDSITIVKHPLHHSVRGLFQYYKRNSIIYINSNLLPHDQRVVCAHELGHTFLHTKHNILFIENSTFLSKSKLEKEANIFAAELLLPDDLFVSYRDYTLKEIAIFEGLPYELVKIKYDLY